MELLASKEVLAALGTKKEDLLPKCFNKCCTQYVSSDSARSASQNSIQPVLSRAIDRLFWAWECVFRLANATVTGRMPIARHMHDTGVGARAGGSEGGGGHASCMGTSRQHKIVC